MLIGREIGPFRIERELGSGAMGSVYRAVHRDTGQRVALKFIALGLLANETAVKRFEREADILKQLRHPNIVRLVAHGRYKKTPFFAMEYVEGESLDRVLARRGAFPWDEVVAIGRQLCDALRHAHERGIIHRDLKPSNLMVLPDGALKLTDFGIAKDTDVTALTGANCTVGTAAYMSPEQCRGERNLSAKSDLYSMGVMFYELLTGRKPFIADSPVDMFMKHVNATFERPSRVVLDIPVWLDTLVCQLLEKKPEHRPYDAAMVDKVLGEVEEKVAAQRSAGVDAVTARAGDRGGKRPADDTDRAAARTLREAVTRRKLRKKWVPLHQRQWVRALGLVAVLAALGGLLVWATKPPSADQLYAKAKTALETNDADRALPTIERYLARFGGQTDARTEELRAAQERLTAQKRERQLHNRFNSRLNFKPEDDGEKLGYQALKHENEGELDEARGDWKEMAEKFKDAGDPDAAAYAWLARKKLADLEKNLPFNEQRLQRALDQAHALQPPEHKPEFGPVERECFEALRFERFGDLPAARDRWEKVRDDNLKELDARPWVLLAAAHARGLKARAESGKEKEKEFRVKLLTDKLAEATRLARSNPDPHDLRTVLSICRDIIALYEKSPDPDVSSFAPKAEQVRRALGGT
jgi:serine/threonine-protein kinase